ncbi:hypothetical protein ACQ3I4_11240 [Zafaria sp. Z1313]|uniref:hypothetical protein n=1 Tax=Zafaria sp. Z1313 TaxID=3423202 RepID=UPI003D303812
MRDAELREFIVRNRTATRCYLEGRADGYVEGLADGHQQAGDAAELTARKLLATAELGAQQAALAASAAEFLTVPRAAARPMPTTTIRPAPSLAQFLDGLRRGGILRDRQAVAA